MENDFENTQMQNEAAEEPVIDAAAGEPIVDAAPTDHQKQYQDNYDYNVGNNTGYDHEYRAEEDNLPISLGEWILILLLMSIPCVNIILCCVWGFGSQGNITKRNFCRAQLIFIGISILFSVILIVIMSVVIGTIGMSTLPYYY